MKTWKMFVASSLLAGCATEMGTEEQEVASRYVVSCTSALPANFQSKVASRGDALGHFFPGAGFAVVSTTKPSAYASGACLVVPDVNKQWIAPTEMHALPATASPPFTGDDDFLFDLQWGHDAVNAPEAWAAGVRGQGVRVAVLDTGFELTHPDLEQNISPRSRDFTGQGLQYTINDPFSHGTHVAGTIAAADNAFGTIGVAPSAQLLLVKVLRDEGYGDFGDILAGMIYATNEDADIISMSLGTMFPKFEAGGENRHIRAFNQVAMYARQRGTTVIAAVGNANTNLDGAMTHLPSDAAGVIGVSATAPHDWALNPSGSLDFRAGYSNYGAGAVEFAGPGGDVYQEPNFDQFCVVGIVEAPCFVFDLVFSTGSNVDGQLTWFWGAGTSMATPHVSGVAALLLSSGTVSGPAQLEAALRSRATDLGAPDRDPIYGHGRVSTGF